MVKFLKKGIRVDGQYHPAWYSIGGRGDGKNIITIYAKNYGRFGIGASKEFLVENDTDTMTDYFDTDKIRIPENHPRYQEALQFCK